MPYRDRCEGCHTELRGTDEVYVCSYDCTFCVRCSPGPERICANCGGELVRRARRTERGDERPVALPSSRLRGSPCEVSSPARSEDIEEVAPLFDAYRQFYRQPSDLALARQFLADRLRRSESTVYLARADGRAVGFVQLYPVFSSISCKPLWILNDLFVAAEFRQRGIASRLLERTKELARDTHAAGVLLDTAMDNPAQHLYEAHGWKQDREFLHYEWTAAAADDPVK